MPYPLRCLRAGWMELWAALSNERCPCPSPGTRWSFKSLATQNILWFYDTQQKVFQHQICSHCGVPNIKMCWEGLRDIFSRLLGNSWLYMYMFLLCFCFLSVSCTIVPSALLLRGWASFSAAYAVLNRLGWWQIFSADMSQGTLLSIEKYLQKKYLQTELITQMVGILQRFGVGFLKALGTPHA